MTNQLYSYLIAPMTSDLLKEVIIIGLFIVFAGHIRAGFFSVGKLNTSMILKRGVLLASILLLTLYNTVSYRLDAESSTTFPAIDELSTLAKVRLLTLAPLDLAITAVSALLFLVLSYESLLGGVKCDTGRELAIEIRRVFLLTSLWHSLVVVWWLVMQTDAMWPSTAFHTGFAVVHLACGIGWHWVGVQNEQPRRWNEWLPVLAYASIVVCAYVVRLNWYLNEAVRANA